MLLLSLLGIRCNIMQKCILSILSSRCNFDIFLPRHGLIDFSINLLRKLHDQHEWLKLKNVSLMSKKNFMSQIYFRLIQLNTNLSSKVHLSHTINSFLSLGMLHQTQGRQRAPTISRIPEDRKPGRNDS